MSNFQQFTGPAGESRAYPTYGNLIVTNSDIVDFGSNAVPNDGRWAPHAGPATVQLNASVSAAIIPQMPVTSQVYYSGVGSPPSGSYTVGETAIDSTGSEFLCTASGTPGTWVAVQGGNIPSPTSPSDGQLLAYNASQAKWLPISPSGTSELAYAENVTGTVTTVAANAAATDIPSTTLVVAASTRPVYLSAGFTFLLTGTATAGAYIGIKIVEVSNGTDTPLSWQANAPVPAATINVSGTPQIAGVRLAASTARTRTFKVQTANVGAGHSVNNANAAADFKTWIAAEAR